MFQATDEEYQVGLTCKYGFLSAFWYLQATYVVREMLIMGLLYSVQIFHCPKVYIQSCSCTNTMFCQAKIIKALLWGLIFYKSNIMSCLRFLECLWSIFQRLWISPKIIWGALTEMVSEYFLQFAKNCTPLDFSITCTSQHISNSDQTKPMCGILLVNYRKP